MSEDQWIAVCVLVVVWFMACITALFATTWAVRVERENRKLRELLADARKIIQRQMDERDAEIKRLLRAAKDQALYEEELLGRGER